MKIVPWNEETILRFKPAGGIGGGGIVFYTFACLPLFAKVLSTPNLPACLTPPHLPNLLLQSPKGKKCLRVKFASCEKLRRYRWGGLALRNLHACLPTPKTFLSAKFACLPHPPPYLIAKYD